MYLNIHSMMIYLIRNDKTQQTVKCNFLFERMIGSGMFPIVGAWIAFVLEYALYLPTYMPTYVRTYLPTYLHTYLLTYLPTYLLTYLPNYLPTYLPTHTQVRTSYQYCAAV
jgi:hypothetical protein